MKFLNLFLLNCFCTVSIQAMDVTSFKNKQYGAVDIVVNSAFDMSVRDFKWACQKKPTDYGYVLSQQSTPCNKTYSTELLTPKFYKLLGKSEFKISNENLIEIVNRTLRIAKGSVTKEFIRPTHLKKTNHISSELSELVQKKLLIPNQVHNFVILNKQFSFASKYTSTKDRFSKHRLIAKDFPAVQYAGEFIYVTDRANKFVEFRISGASGTFRPHCIENSFNENDDGAKRFLIENFKDLNVDNVKTFCYTKDTNSSDGVYDAYNSTEKLKGRFVQGLEKYTDYIGGDLYYESQPIQN
jgi:hypothetical protein